VTIPSYSANLQASAGSCTVSASRVDTSIKLDPPPMSGDPAPPVLPLDAGPFLTLTAPNATKTLKLQNGIYSGTEVISSIQVLPNLPPTVTGGPDFLPEGPYTLDNGAGGADIGPFTATLRNPVRVIWDSMSDNTNIDRSKGVTVKWSGGDASNSVVTITGVSSSYQPPIAYSGIFVCFARVDAGQFTVPAFVTQQLPPSPAQPAGSVLSVGTMLADLPIINGVDVTYSIAQQTTGTPVVFK
jgi:hypothetical protein